MENKTRSRVMLAITLFSAIVLSGTVFVCARRAGEEVTQRSFDELTTATKELAKDINNATRTDQTILSAMAELIAGQDDLDGVDAVSGATITSNALKQAVRYAQEAIAH